MPNLGAPTVAGGFDTGFGNSITLKFEVTPDWPKDEKSAIGIAFENGRFDETKFDSVELQIEEGYTYQSLEDAKLFAISEEKTEDSDVTLVTLWTDIPGAEQKKVASFMVKPSIGVETLHKGKLQWLLQDGTTV